VEALSAEIESGKKAKLIADGLESGKLTPSLVEKWANGLSAAALTAYLEQAPVVVPRGERARDRAADDVALSAADGALDRVARTCGMDPEAVRQATRQATRS
jgi:hypothetical protein